MDMSDPQLAELKTAAMAYEDLYIPGLFQEWVEPVLDAAGVAPGDDVLDIACGTGVLARGAADRVGSDGRVAGIDPGPGMLAAARDLAPGIEWKEAVAEDLPFGDASFDAVVSQFGMMFFADRAKAVQEMLRVLRPGGRMAVAVWDSLERTRAYALAVQLLQDMAGTAAADALRAPFVLGEPPELAQIFMDADATGVSVQTRMGAGRFPNVRTMVEADLRGWLPVMGVILEDDLIEEVLTEAEHRLAEFILPDGTVLFDSPAHIVAAHK
jgi:SAM-dependent methyltransferase